MEARYEYQPPSRLSPMDPTRADNAANTDLRSRGMCCNACFRTNAGPVALSENCSAIATESKDLIAFSGLLEPIERAPVATIIVLNGPIIRSMASRILSSLVMSN